MCGDKTWKYSPIATTEPNDTTRRINGRRVQLLNNTGTCSPIVSFLPDMFTFQDDYKFGTDATAIGQHKHNQGSWKPILFRIQTTSFALCYAFLGCDSDTIGRLDWVRGTVSFHWISFLIDRFQVIPPKRKEPKDIPINECVCVCVSSETPSPEPCETFPTS